MNAFTFYLTDQVSLSFRPAGSYSFWYCASISSKVGQVLCQQFPASFHSAVSPKAFPVSQSTALPGILQGGNAWKATVNTTRQSSQRNPEGGQVLLEWKAAAEGEQCNHSKCAGTRKLEPTIALKLDQTQANAYTAEGLICFKKFIEM